MKGKFKIFWFLGGLILVLASLVLWQKRLPEAKEDAGRKSQFQTEVEEAKKKEEAARLAEEEKKRQEE